MAKRSFAMGLTLVALGWGFQNLPPAFSTELDGFAINTQDKAVTITLFTDQRATYATEQQGKQFTIVLPNTQLSKEQLNNGLPVVIDNKNRFIGRAVPSDDGKVKIILPNLPANDYSVSIQQKHTGPSSPTTHVSESLKPRPAVKTEEVQFEQVAANFPKPATKPVQNRPANRLKLSPAPVKAHGGIWNPYVYRPSDFKRTTSHAVATPKANPPKTAVIANEPINTVSVAESLQQPSRESSSNASSDPLWYLHALPPATNQAVLNDTLQGPAVQTFPMGQPTPAIQPKADKPAPSEIRVLASEIKHGLKSLPRWLIITVAVFLGGMGLFTLIGGLVLLKLLFSQTRQQFGGTKAPEGMPYMTGVVPMYAHPDGSLNFGPANQTPQNSYASRPTYGQTSLLFEDKAAVQSQDYLKQSSPSVSQAVYNTTLVRFPASRKQRSMARKKAN